VHFLSAFLSVQVSIENAIDRFSFNNLLPCPSSYAEILKQAQSIALSSSLEIGTKRRPIAVLRPDLSKMQKFHPALVNLKSSANGEMFSAGIKLPDFPLPSTILEFLYKIPPFAGLLPNIDKVLHSIMQIPVSTLRKQSMDDGVKEEKNDLLSRKFNAPPPNDPFKRKRAPPRSRT
jgi:hypothetical protein